MVFSEKHLINLQDRLRNKVNFAFLDDLREGKDE